MDEIASDGRLCYLPENDDIAGLYEHSASLSSVKTGNDLSVVRRIAQGVRNGEIHVRQEVFVAAFARNDESDYGANPVLLMPTCKQGSYQAHNQNYLNTAGSLSDVSVRPILAWTNMVNSFRRLTLSFNFWVTFWVDLDNKHYRHDFKRMLRLKFANMSI